MRLPSGISLDKSAGMSNDTCFFPPRIWRSQFFFVRRIRTSHCFTWINESWNLPRQIWWTTEWKWRVFHVGMRYLNGSWYTYEWVMTQIRTSQGTRMHRHVTHSHESWLTGTYTLMYGCIYITSSTLKYKASCNPCSLAEFAPLIVGPLGA